MGPRSLLIVIAIILASAACLSAQEIPGAAKIATGQPATLSYEQAVRLAIDNNLATLRAHERRNEARGQQEQARAPLLPNVSGVAYQADLTVNLVALGFQPGTFPGISRTFLGPFKNFDARLLLSQKVFDLSAIRNYQAGKAGVRAAEVCDVQADSGQGAGRAVCHGSRLERRPRTGLRPPGAAR